MGKNVMSNLVIESKGHCFFCMATISPCLPDNNKSELLPVHSLHYLSGFLRINMKKVFIENGDIPPYLMSKVEMSRLKAHLCAGCASINDTFSEVYRRLEKIEMELLSSLEPIYKELLEAEGTNQYQNLLNPVERSGDEWVGKAAILDVLRKEAIRKCSIKFQNCRPRINLQNMSKDDMTKAIQKCKLNSGKMKKCKTDFINSIVDGREIKTKQEEVLRDQSFGDAHADQQSDFDFSRGSPPSPACSETQIIVKSEHTESSSLIKSDRRRGRDSRLTIHIETIKNKTVGHGPARRKLRCKICSKVFSDRPNIKRHVKMVHLKEKQFRCGVCPQAFTLKQSLNVHMLIHAGIKEHKCHLCLKDFSRKTSLKRHIMITHRGIKPFRCKRCDKTYSDGRDLNKHERRAHNGNAHQLRS